jgi:hypothetical protein
MLAGINSGLRHQRRRRSVRVEQFVSLKSFSSRSHPMLPWLIHPLSQIFCYYSTEGIVSIVAINNVVCIYNSICSLPLLLLIVVGHGFLPSSPSFQLRFEEGYDSGEGLLLGLLHCSMMMMLIVD